MSINQSRAIILKAAYVILAKLILRPNSYEHNLRRVICNEIKQIANKLLGNSVSVTNVAPRMEVIRRSTSFITNLSITSPDTEIIAIMQAELASQYIWLNDIAVKQQEFDKMLVTQLENVGCCLQREMPPEVTGVDFDFFSK